MKKQITTTFILLALFSFLITSCTKETISPSIKFDQTNSVLKVGTKDTLGIAITPANVPISSFTMTSSDTSVATVDARGVISAKSHGNAIITATAEDGSTTDCYVTVTKWTVYNPENSGEPYDIVRTIAIDSDNNIRLGTWATTPSGVAKFNGTDWTNYYSPNIPQLDVSSIKTDAYGNVWIATYANGVYKYDGSTWTNYYPKDYLSAYISSMAIDSQNNIWFANFGTGVSKFDGTNWTNYNRQNGLVSDTINCIAIDAHNNVWVGTEQGISEFDGKKWTTYNTSNGLVNNSVSSVAIDVQGNKWFGTAKGISEFDGTTWTTYDESNSGLPSRLIRFITTDSQNNIWIVCGSSYNYVVKFDGTRWTKYPTRNFGEITTIKTDSQGNKWLGTWGGGLVKLQD